MCSLRNKIIGVSVLSFLKKNSGPPPILRYVFLKEMFTPGYLFLKEMFTPGYLFLKEMFTPDYLFLREMFTPGFTYLSRGNKRNI